MKFGMPFGGTITIIPSIEPEKEPEMDEEVEGIIYQLIWNDELLPWYAKTRLEATKIGLGCQYGANEMMKKYEGK